MSDRRTFLKWSAPIVSFITLPAHAQATNIECNEQLITNYELCGSTLFSSSAKDMLEVDLQLNNGSIQYKGDHHFCNTEVDVTIETLFAIEGEPSVTGNNSGNTITVPFNESVSFEDNVDTITLTGYADLITPETTYNITTTVSVNATLSDGRTISNEKAITGLITITLLNQNDPDGLLDYQVSTSFTSCL